MLARSALHATLAQHRAAIDDTLRDIAASLAGADVVSQAMRYAIAGDGKRIRPILCLAAMDAVGAAGAGETRGAAPLRAACAVELVHTYSLVHDDLPCMDDDALRRGRATVHCAYDTRTAMLAGFALVPLACGVLARAAADMGVPAAARRDAVRALCAGAGAAGMVGGQVLDLDAELVSVPMAELRRIHALKTGALFGAALRVGGILGGASTASVAALGRFGERLGLAFQITDDVLDETEPAAALGKTPGKDRDAGKSTFVSLLGVAAARAAARAEADAAVVALEEADIDSALLRGLARFAVDRDR